MGDEVKPEIAQRSVEARSRAGGGMFGGGDVALVGNAADEIPKVWWQASQRSLHIDAELFGPGEPSIVGKIVLRPERHRRRGPAYVAWRDLDCSVARDDADECRPAAAARIEVVTATDQVEQQILLEILGISRAGPEATLQPARPNPRRGDCHLEGFGIDPSYICVLTKHAVLHSDWTFERPQDSTARSGETRRNGEK